MPNKSARPCPGKGPRRNHCPNLIKGTERLCPACQPYEKAEVKRYDDERGNSGDRGYDASWRKVRDVKLAHDPLCERCLQQGRDKAASMVHHIKPVIECPELRLQMTNLMSLCNPCHEEIEGNRWNNGR